MNEKKKAEAEPAFLVGGWSVLPDRNLIRQAGATVHLEPRVMDLLVYLAERPDEVLSTEQIINDVWPHAYVTDGALLTALSALRKALGDDPKRSTYIETIPKRGYRLIAASSASTSVLAVLPIRNATGDPGQSFLADGLTNGLIDALGTIPALRVISRSSAMSVGHAKLRVHDVATRLGARLVLTGSIAKDRRRGLVVEVELTDVKRNARILNETYKRPESEWVELQQDIIHDVGSIMEDRLRSAPDPKRNRAHPDAVIEYLRGRYHFYRLSPDHFSKALAHFERAIDIDPRYAQPHVGIADVWGGFAYWGARRASEVRDHVLMHVRKAIEIDADNSEALAIRASVEMYFAHDWAAAETDLRRAVALNANLCHTRLISSILLGTLKRPKAYDEIEQALRIDPLNPAVLLVRALIHSGFGEFDAALQDADELLSIDARHRPGLQLRADLNWLRGGSDGLRFECDVWQSDAQVLAALTSHRDAAAALQSAVEVLTARAQGNYVPPYEVARLLSLGGRIPAAVDCIEEALDDGDFMRVDFLQMSPAFAAVRAHAHYRGIADRLGLPVR